MAKAGHYEDVIRILEDQNTELINNANVIETGNRLISTILNTKYSEAREKGITVRFIPENLSSFNINERDGIIIFSNILNNAIEATEKCPIDKRFISIKTAIDNNQLVFSVRNSCVQSNHDLKSRKKDIITHGYGLDNVIDAVKRNKGNCFFEFQDDEFVSVVIIPF